jgi:hypothetical protein
MAKIKKYLFNLLFIFVALFGNGQTQPEPINNSSEHDFEEDDVHLFI